MTNCLQTREVSLDSQGRPRVITSVLRRAEGRTLTFRRRSDEAMQCVCLATLSCLTLCKPIDCSRQAPPTMGFPRQGYWSGLLFPPPGELPHPGVKPPSPASAALAGGFFATVSAAKPLQCCFKDPTCCLRPRWRKKGMSQGHRCV